MKTTMFFICSFFFLMPAITAENMSKEKATYFVIHTTTDNFEKKSTCYILLMNNDEWVEKISNKKYKLGCPLEYNRRKVLILFDAIAADNQVELIGIYNFPKEKPRISESHDVDNGTHEKPEEVVSNEDEYKFTKRISVGFKTLDKEKIDRLINKFSEAKSVKLSYDKEVIIGDTTCIYYYLKSNDDTECVLQVLKKDSLIKWASVVTWSPPVRK